MSDTRRNLRQESHKSFPMFWGNTDVNENPLVGRNLPNGFYPLEEYENFKTMKHLKNCNRLYHRCKCKTCVQWRRGVTKEKLSKISLREQINES